MTPFLLYIVRAGLYLSLFYAFYLLVMRRATFFRLNRILLLSGSYICLLLPFVRLRNVSAASIASDLTIMAVGTGSEGAAVPSPSPWPAVLFALFITGALVTLTLYGVSAWKMGCLIRKGERLEREGCHLVILEEDIPSFSWGRKVVIGRKDLEENPAIFIHELMHVQCRHSLDLLLLLPLQLFFWWNPLVWVTREELRLLHEYEADEGVIQKGIDATQYQLLLVRKAVGDERFSLASGFQHAQLSSRITMMLKPSSSAWKCWSYLALIPVLAVMMYACNAPKAIVEPDHASPYAITVTDEPSARVLTIKKSGEIREQEAVPYSLIECTPKFNGGDTQEFSKWVNSQLRYPEHARQNGIQGRVTLQFIVGADGMVRNVSVLRSAQEELDAEAIRVISASPRWEPGMLHGEAVSVTFVFPVVFQLR